MKIPAAILDDRNALVGTSGSGKTYAAKGMVEDLLDTGARVGIVDPLGVWWGLTSNVAGDGPGYPLVIFGGKHGDIPLTEAAGAAIGDMVATGDFSWIVDLSELPSQAARRRFMKAFAEAIYSKNAETLHLILDEADLWCPQKPMEDVAAVLGARIDEIVRRGRIKGFVPWLITQRPAVIHKDVLSQLDTLIALKLTSSQDRNALDAWIEGQADKAEQKRIYGALPKLPVGKAIVWSPGHDLLVEHQFRKLRTFDSSRTPKRGEKVRSATKRAKIDIEAMRSKLATVTAEAEANDPKLLKAKIRELEGKLAKASPVGSDKNELSRLQQDAWADGSATGFADGVAVERANWMKHLPRFVAAVDAIKAGAADIDLILQDTRDLTISPARSKSFKAQPAARATVTVEAKRMRAPTPAAPPKPTEGINGPQQRILDALAWWASVGIHQPSRIQVAVIARYSPSGGAFQNPLGGLRTMGLVEYPSSGTVALTVEGGATANHPQTPATVAEFHERLQGILNGPQWRILSPIIDAYPRSISRAEVAAAAGYAPDGGAFQNPLGSLRTLGLIDYPSPGQVVALPVLFVEGR